MKIYNNTNITYSAIEHNSRKNTKQNFPADLEKKMTQYTDTVSISKTGQERFRYLSSVSSMDYQIFFLCFKKSHLIIPFLLSLQFFLCTFQHIRTIKSIYQ